MHAAATGNHAEGLKKALREADMLLDQSLKAMQLGQRLEAMEEIYAASCLIGELCERLENSTPLVEKPSAVQGDSPNNNSSRKPTKYWECRVSPGVDLGQE